MAATPNGAYNALLYTVSYPSSAGTNVYQLAERSHEENGGGIELAPTVGGTVAFHSMKRLATKT